MQYISNNPQDVKQMLEVIGVGSFDDLIAKVPKRLRQFDMKVPAGISELELTREMRELGSHNENFDDYACYLGGGVYDHFAPEVVGHLAHRSEFITSYTPYQGEASQGTLQSIYEYQSLICELTGMDYSNASMYDGGSSLAEAALLALRFNGRRKILVAGSIHPEYRSIVKTYTSCIGVEVEELPLKEGALDAKDLAVRLNADVSAVLIQHPNFFGILENMEECSRLTHQAGALFIACVNPVSLGVLKTPGEYGADIAVGEGQPLGNPVAFGGPHFGFFTVREPLLRKIPGRIAGATVDKVGRRSFVLTLQAREQHIRREKATSNICTNHGLCALKGAIYLTMLGKKGLRKLALLNLENAHNVYEKITKIKGVKPFSGKPFFNEFAVTIEKDSARLRQSLESQKILGPLSLAPFYPEIRNGYLVAVTECRTADENERLVKAVETA